MDGGMIGNEIADRRAGEHHDTDRGDDRSDHYRNLVNQPHRRNDRVQGEDDVQEDDLHQDPSERPSPALGLRFVYGPAPFQVVVELPGGFA